VKKAKKCRRHRITEREYVHKITCYLRKKYWDDCEVPEREVRATLERIFHLLHRNQHNLLIFTAHVIFGTGGLLRLQNGHERWASRGILQITTEDNYKTLSELIRNDIFLRCPQALASLHRLAVQGSILFWIFEVEKNFGPRARPSFWETLVRILNPSEVRCPWTWKSERKIRHRFRVYHEVCKLFCERPDFGCKPKDRCAPKECGPSKSISCRDC